LTSLLDTLELPFQLAAAADVLVDRRVGIVRWVEESPREAGGPAFFHFAAKACNTAAFTRQRNFCDTGGASASREIAAAKAIGEAVERYCSAIYDVDELPLHAARDAPFECVDPGSFALYSDDQYATPGFPWVPFDDRTTVRWTPAWDAVDGSSVHVPGARVFMPYSYYIGTGDAPIDQPISTGLACHGGLHRAAVSAACEVVERDAVMIAWQSMLAPPQILVETLSDRCYDLVERFEAAASTVAMFDITLDHGIPTILSVLRAEHADAPGLVVAGASSPDPEDAARKSLEELAHSRPYCQFVKTHLPRHEPDPPLYESVRDQVTHLSFYTDHENARLADFLFTSRERREFDEIEGFATGDPALDLAALADRIAATGERLLLADLTTDDVRELGLRVVRAVIPGFQPLHMGYGLRSLGGRRLWTVPQALGHRGVTPQTGDNPAPHPYP
jgi:ribosomal protein S12 methylthiotransferase accessory factor